MQIGQVIRKYRKNKEMTQEEMANRLGVTAPAVNKWENGNSMPDIALLPPIARLLGISLDTLLNFQEDLTDNEVNELIRVLDEKLKTEEFGEVFGWAREQMEQYPNCEQLLLYMTVVLRGACIGKKIDDRQCEAYLLNVNERLLLSNDEKIRTNAADALYGFYIGKERYDKAEEYLAFLSPQSPERKRRQALLYRHSGRTEEAYRTYEELLYSEFNMLHSTFHGLFAMYAEEQNLEKAEYLEERMILLVRAFDMGQYHEASDSLDLMMAKKDRPGTLRCARQMAESIGQFGSWCDAPLYAHIPFKEISGDFMEKMRETMRDFFGDEKLFGYMQGDKEWEAMRNALCCN